MKTANEVDRPEPDDVGRAPAARRAVDALVRLIVHQHEDVAAGAALAMGDPGTLPPRTPTAPRSDARVGPTDWPVGLAASNKLVARSGFQVDGGRAHVPAGSGRFSGRRIGAARSLDDATRAGHRDIQPL